VSAIGGHSRDTRGQVSRGGSNPGPVRASHIRCPCRAPARYAPPHPTRTRHPPTLPLERRPPSRLPPPRQLSPSALAPHVPIASRAWAVACWRARAAVSCSSRPPGCTRASWCAPKPSP
jgi:hypothetical protein